MALVGGFLSNGVNAQIYINSNFQTGTDGWTTGQASSTCLSNASITSTWALSSTSGGSPVALGSICYGTPNDGGMGPENSWILSPVFTPTSSNLTVEFDSWTSNETGFPCAYDVELVEITQNGGLTWSPIHSYIPTLHGIENDQVWRHYIMNATVTPSLTTRIRFRYDSGDDYSGSSSPGWFVDNILVKSELLFTYTKANASCVGQNNGSISINPSNGVPPFQYSINNGATYQASPNFNNVEVGSYQIKVKDATNIVSDPVSVVIAANSSVLAQLNVIGLTNLCQGQSSILEALDSAGYNFRWKRNGLFISSPNSPRSLNANQTGNYAVEVSKNGCVAVSNSINVQVNSKPDLVVSEIVNSCVGLANGKILFGAPNNGTPPFKYSINGGSTYGFTSVFFNLPPSQYGISIKDDNNCISNNQVIDITEAADTIAPSVSTQNTTIYLDQFGVATLSAIQVNDGSSDNCTIASYSVVPSTFDSSNIGSNLVTLSVTDASSNVGNATTIVTVLDTIAPKVKVKNAMVYLNENGIATLQPSQINDGTSDNSGSFTLGVGPNNFSCTNLRQNTVSLTATDPSGNIASLTAIVTVFDTIKPTLLLNPIVSVTPGSNGLLVLTRNGIDNGSFDNCGIASFNISPNTFTNNGTYTVNITVTDFSGNVSVGTITAIVSDNTPPTIITRNITRSLSASGTVTISAADIDSATFDASGIASLEINDTLFTCADLGTNTIVFTASDNFNNTSTKTVIVTIVDAIAPVAITKNITLALNANGNATLSASDINNGSSDNCGIASMTVFPSSFNCSSIGTNDVTLTVTDNNGNVSSAVATVTINGSQPISSSPNIYIGENNRVTWSNVPFAGNGQSGVIGLVNNFNTPVLSISSSGGNLKTNGCNGIGVTGGSLSNNCNGNAAFIDNTVNRNQSISISLNNNNVGITQVVFESPITAKIAVIGKRNGQTVLSYSKYMLANDRDTFDFRIGCLMRGICTVDEVEFRLSSQTNNCRRKWNKENDFDNDEFEDGINVPSNCAFALKNAFIFVQQKDTCKIGDINFSWNAGVFASRVISVSGNMNVGASTTHSLGLNSDGNFATGSPLLPVSSRRIAIGYNWLGFPAAWEVNNNCSVRSIRQGMFTNMEPLPVGSLLNLLFFNYTVTSVDANGQFIYGKRISKSNGSSVDIRWKVNEFFQRIWIANPTVISFGKNGIEEVVEDQTISSNSGRSFGELNLNVFPNPSNDFFTFNVQSESTEPISVELTDMAGRLVYSATGFAANQNFSLGDNLMAGVYLAQVKQGNSIKIVKITRVN